MGGALTDLKHISPSIDPPPIQLGDGPRKRLGVHQGSLRRSSCPHTCNRRSCNHCSYCTASCQRRNSRQHLDKSNTVWWWSMTPSLGKFVHPGSQLPELEVAGI